MGVPMGATSSTASVVRLEMRPIPGHGRREIPATASRRIRVPWRSRRRGVVRHAARPDETPARNAAMTPSGALAAGSTTHRFYR